MSTVAGAKVVCGGEQQTGQERQTEAHCDGLRAMLKESELDHRKHGKTTGEF